MIARLRGTLAGVGEDHAIVDVGGVGYLVTVAPATLERLPRVGEPVELHTELHMREDGISLYGFLEATDRIGPGQHDQVVGCDSLPGELAHVGFRGGGIVEDGQRPAGGVADEPAGHDATGASPAAGRWYVTISVRTGTA